VKHINFEGRKCTFSGMHVHLATCYLLTLQKLGVSQLMKVEADSSDGKASALMT
jgi:hypothetical protein